MVDFTFIQNPLYIHVNTKCHVLKEIPLENYSKTCYQITPLCFTMFMLHYASLCLCFTMFILFTMFMLDYFYA